MLVGVVFLCLLVAAKIFPRVLPLMMGFPREVGRSGSARARDGNFAKTCFEMSVGKWSANGRHFVGNETTKTNDGT